MPTCPSWTVYDGVAHIAGAHRWAMMFLRAGPDSRERHVPDVSDAPEGEAVLAWYAGTVDELVAELGRHSPGDPTRAFIGAATAAFWMRRMTQEVSIHRWDLQNATASGAEPITPWTAADGITRLRSDGVDVLTDTDVHADVSLRGSASDLDLALWRRLPVSAVEVDGDRGVLDGLLGVVVI